MPSVIAQSGANVPDGGTEVVVWIAIAAVIVDLYLVIRRTRLNQAASEAEMRRHDPDMRSSAAPVRTADHSAGRDC